MVINKVKVHKGTQRTMVNSTKETTTVGRIDEITDNKEIIRINILANQ